MNFPTTGYVVSVTHLDTYIDVRTQVVTEKNRYCAALLIGHTNYQIRIGDCSHGTIIERCSGIQPKRRSLKPGKLPLGSSG